MDDMLTLTEIAERTGTSKVTARRYLDAGKFPDAQREDGRGDGRWLVPWSNVVASGLARKKGAMAAGAGAGRADDAIARTLEAQARTIEAQARTIQHLSGLVERLLDSAAENNGGT